MDTMAVVLQKPEHLTLSRLDLVPPGEADVLVDVAWSGISTGTERLLWSGTMPPFPGMGYPLVPGYETVGKVVAAGPLAQDRVGDFVFVPGARCYGVVRGLFGGAASRIVLPAAKATPIDGELAERGVLLALAATAYHAVAGGMPELIIGHGVLGRLVARLALLQDGAAPTVWERNKERASGAVGYQVIDPEADPRRDYRTICDVSGDAGILDAVIGRIAAGGEIVLAGFYCDRLSFAFPPAFMREARLRVAAEWRPDDLLAVKRLIEGGQLSLDGLITHRADAMQADAAYRTAFGDPACLKMILDWRACA